MKIEVIGSGCPTCKKLHELTCRAVNDLGVDAKVRYSDDVQKIVEMGVMSSPVLVVDGKVVLAGSVPNIEKIKMLISGVSKGKLSKCDCSNCDRCC